MQDDKKHDLSNQQHGFPDAFGRTTEPDVSGSQATPQGEAVEGSSRARLGDHFAAAVETDQADETTRLDLDELSQDLMRSMDPISELRHLEADILAREGGSRVGTLPPSNLEIFLAHALQDAGLDETDLVLPALRVVRPHTSNLFYLRVGELEMSYAAKLRVLSIEAALNAALLASLYFEDANSRSLEDLVKLSARVMASITSQVPTISDWLPTKGELYPHGEWAVRKGISTGIECAQLPYRLRANFRTNVAGGDVACVIELTPPSIMPAHAWVDGAGIVPTTTSMRRSMATDYNLRLGILLAACAFRCVDDIKRVWVAGTIDTPQSHSCYYSVCFDREGFSAIPLDGSFEPLDVYRWFGASLDESAGTLLPVAQTFSLDDERFCPTRRYESIEGSSRILRDPFANALGSRQVSGLAIDESSKRSEIATEIGRRITSSTEGNVHAIMELAGNDSDPTVREAARRCVSKLIEGTLADDDVQAIEDEFVSGDALSRAVEKAEQQFDDNDFNATRTTIESALSTLEQDHVYEDDELVEWRCFDNYVDRVLYNRLLWDQEHETRLAPRAYLEALLISSSLALGADDLDRAQNQAKRALSLSPLNTAAHIQLIKCLSAGEHYEEVVKEINRMLELGHDPTTLGYGYYFMALAQWMRDDTRAAFACYERATSFLPPRLVNLSAGIRPYLTTLTLGNNITVPDREISSTLVSRGIVDAPTYMMTDTFLGCTRAALDAELFPVAREFLSTLDMMTHDDVYFGMLRSLESEPDR